MVARLSKGKTMRKTRLAPGPPPPLRLGRVIVRSGSSLIARSLYRCTSGHVPWADPARTSGVGAVFWWHAGCDAPRHENDPRAVFDARRVHARCRSAVLEY